MLFDINQVDASVEISLTLEGGIALKDQIYTNFLMTPLEVVDKMWNARSSKREVKMCLGWIVGKDGMKGRIDFL